ncbi:type II toxin-antitoxin system VapC family toxin [Candidatus Bathyarchaeota archaeon]|nr:type II toxin-antitoxin system VapC family toxin [Candidatus Bathyarchaeota archaeon]MBS7631826.1 type II toxin-antitoxin system VapC family toxin [Candidatus Bathyarchaeota archaeon]
MEDAGNQVIIDTDILVDVLRGLEKPVTFIAELERKGLTLSTTVINAFELYYGACKSTKKLQNLTATRKLLEQTVILNMTHKSAEKAGEIHAELEAKGQPIGIRDVMIGAIALIKGYPLITRNTHLQKIEGLNLITAP